MKQFTYKQQFHSQDSFKFSFLGNFVLTAHFHHPLGNQSAVQNTYSYSNISQ